MAEETAVAIVTAMDANLDGSLSEAELVDFFKSLSSSASDIPEDERPDRPPEDEAKGLIEEFGENGAIPVPKFQEFLVAFSTEAPEKLDLILGCIKKLRQELYNTMLARVKEFDGFLAALDQSGGSSPKALLAYGVEESEYNGDEEMYDKIHQMRERIVSCPAFNGNDVLGAILFEMTMDRHFEGVPAARYLWKNLNVVPFVKCATLLVYHSIMIHV